MIALWNAAHPLILNYARQYIIAVLHSGIRTGYLEVKEGDNCFVFGCKDIASCPEASVIVEDSAVWLRLFRTMDLGFAESYMLGEVTVPNLRAVCELFLCNSANLGGLSTLLYQIYSNTVRLTAGLAGQSLTRSKLNAVAGYDASNTLFQAFLSKEMMYSCALWDEKEGGVDGDVHSKLDYDVCALESAQTRKIYHVLKKAKLKPGDRVLEFGSGWCAMAIHAAKKFGCTVDTLTLSIEQKTLGEQRVREAGLDNLIRVHLLDYRQLPRDFDGAFDAFISIEMIEHVGPQHYQKYFSIIDRALKSTCATAVVSSSTISEGKYTRYPMPEFSNYYMWPNGALPSPTSLIEAAYKATGGSLRLDTIENHADHYPRTLREWDRRFRQNIAQSDAKILDERPHFTGDIDRYEMFKRKWLYMFPYAEAGFATGYLGCHMLTFTR